MIGNVVPLLHEIISVVFETAASRTCGGVDGLMVWDSYEGFGLYEIFLEKHVLDSRTWNKQKLISSFETWIYFKFLSAQVLEVEMCWTQ
jgi:hypothetical protein